MSGAYTRPHENGCKHPGRSRTNVNSTDPYLPFYQSKLSTTGGRPMLPKQIAGIPIPDSALAAEATELVRDTESELLFDHSLRVYLFGALQGRRLGLSYDPELLYI